MISQNQQPNISPAMSEEARLQQERQETEQQHVARLSQNRARESVATANQQNNQGNDTETGAKNESRKISTISFVIVLLLAILADVFGWVSIFFFTVPVVGQTIYFSAYIVKFIFGGIIYIWAYLNGGKSPMKILGAELGSLVIELIPGLGDILPTFTAIVIGVYLNNKLENKFTNLPLKLPTI